MIRAAFAFVALTCLAGPGLRAADTAPAPAPAPPPAASAPPAAPPAADPAPPANPGLIDMVGEHDARMKAARDSELWIKQGPDKQLKTDELWITGSKAKEQSCEPTAEERAAAEYLESMKRAILGDKSANPAPPADSGLRRGELDGLRPQTIAPAVGPAPEATTRSGSGSAAVSTPAFQPAWRTTPAGSAPAATALPPSPWSSPSASPAASALTVPVAAPVLPDRPMSTRPFEPVRTDRR